MALIQVNVNNKTIHEYYSDLIPAVGEELYIVSEPTTIKLVERLLVQRVQRTLISTQAQSIQLDCTRTLHKESKNELVSADEFAFNKGKEQGYNTALALLKKLTEINHPTTKLSVIIELFKEAMIKNGKEEERAWWKLYVKTILDDFEAANNEAKTMHAQALAHYRSELNQMK